MEQFINIIYVFFLIAILGIAVFNWMYKLGVEKVVRTEGFTIPQNIMQLLTVNLFLPLLAFFFLVTLLILVG